MSLDFYLMGEPEESDCECERCENVHRTTKKTCRFSSNITHNLTEMFDEAGVYEILWRGDGLRAGDVLPRLEEALALMRADPPRFEKHNSPNGWGLYIHAVPWLARVVDACREYPDAKLECSR